MANNRLFIRCKHCGECFCIGKHSLGSLHTWGNDDNDEFVEGLNDFYRKHCYCSNHDHYWFELCEEFPGEMTSNNIDCDGKVVWFN